MSDFDYYKAPSDKIFNEVKDACIILWQTYDDTYGYATEKVNRIKDIKNIQDNTGYMISMFDYDNKMKLIKMVEGETKEWLEQLYAFAGIPYPFMNRYSAI